MLVAATIKILTVDPRWQHPDRIAFMREYLPDGCELVIPDSFEPEHLRQEAKTARVLLGGQVPLTAELMAAAPDVCLIGKLGTGVDSIDVEAATTAGLPVAHAPGWLRASPVAEHVFTLLLMLCRRPWLWSSGEALPLHLPLEGATIGIVGLGNIGQRVAQRAAAFGMAVMAHTRTRGKFQPEGFAVQETETLDELLGQADYVVLSLPLLPETEGLIGSRELALMKSSSFLINVSRGRHVVSDDLVTALRAGEIAGAGLDVTDSEPLPATHPLRSLPNVVLSPHVAGQSEWVQRESCRVLCTSIAQALNGERVQAIVNPEIYSS
ncbi:D-glycerate dehydrogenase [Candidatus Entotheonella serta]|nr:D-glycerate dehydrogenase [Candidatus Entotheonella serta]